MSVFITLRVPADADKLNKGLESRWPAIMERAKQHGCLHHRFLANDNGEILVLDEWETEDGFQRFFAASDDIREMMGEIGVTSEPELTIWRPLDTPDQL